MQADAGIDLAVLKVDGGASANNLLMQFQSDVLQVNVQRPVVQETTALGAAYLAGLAVGFWENREAICKNWVLETEFTPQLESGTADELYSRWQKAVERSIDWDVD
jgi:glycerol kinase